MSEAAPEARSAAAGGAAGGERETVDVAAVICTHTHERRGMLVAAVRSIASGTRRPRDVVLVVDRNPGLHAELLDAEWPLPVRVLASPGSGLAAARNAGWRATLAPLVAFVDDDAVVSPTWLEELTEAQRRYAADVIGGRIDPAWTGGAPAWYGPLLGWVVGCSYEGLPTRPARVRNVIGCNMLFRRELLERLGGFDPTLGRSGRGLAGCEETELCIRANEAGANVMLVPGAAVEQVLPSERATLGYAVRRGWHEGRSKRLLVARHGNVLATESRYARSVVHGALGHLARALVGRSSAELARAVALVAVLGSTTLSYLAFGLPLVSGMVAAAPVRNATLAARKGA